MIIEKRQSNSNEFRIVCQDPFFRKNIIHYNKYSADELLKSVQSRRAQNQILSDLLVEKEIQRDRDSKYNNQILVNDEQTFYNCYLNNNIQMKYYQMKSLITLLNSREYFNIQIRWIQYKQEQYLFLEFWNQDQINQNDYKKIIYQVQKQQEILEMEIKQKDMTLANVSHDFKTPINSIVTILDYLLQDFVLEKEIFDHLKIIKTNTSLLLFMVQDILDAQNLKKNKLSIRKTRFRIDVLVEEIISVFKIQAKQKGIQIQMNADIDEILAYMYSDQIRIKQILYNLISNAMKFTLKGFIQIVIKRQEEQNEVSDSINIIRSHRNIYLKSSQSVFQIIVTDTGVGMPEDIVPKLFNRFSTFDNSGLNKNGTGLGLTNCQRLVGILGPIEKIYVSSQLNQGSSFSFYLYGNCGQSQSSSSSFSNNERFQDQSFYKNSQTLIFQSFKNIKFQKQKCHSDLQYNQQIDENKVRGQTIHQNNEDQFKQFNQIINEDEDDLDEKQCNIDILQKNQIKKNKRNQISILYSDEKDEKSGILQNEEDSSYQLQYVKKSLDYSNENFHILVVDDEPFNILGFKQIMKKYSRIIIKEAYNGQQAIESILEEGNKFVCAFIDLTMPIMNGQETAKQILKMVNQEEIEQIGLIALSGYDSDDVKEECFKIGFNAFLTKPISQKQIQDILQDLKLL